MFRFSLKTWLILFTILVVVIGAFAHRYNRGRKQAWAIESAQHVDFQYDDGAAGKPEWLVRLLGVDFFANVISIDVDEDSNLAAVDFLISLGHLRHAILQRDDIQSIAALAENSELETLEISSDVDLTPIHNLKKIYDLHVGLANQKDINQIGKMVDLHYLVAESAAADLSPLENLSRLKRLTLFAHSDDVLTDLNFLGSLNELEEVRLYGNFKSLDGMENLKNLQLACLLSDQLVDVNSIELLVASDVDISSRKLVDIGPIGRMEPQHLTLHVPKASDFSSFADQAGIERLTLTANCTDSRWLDGLIYLEGLSIDAPIEDMNFLEHTRPFHLYFENTKVTDPAPLLFIKDTYGIDIDGSLIEDARPIADVFDRTDTFELSNSPLKHLPKFNKDARFWHFNISNTLVSDPAMIPRADNLYIGGTGITDLSFLRDQSMRTLDISRLKVTDFSPLARINTRWLILDGNRIPNLGFVSEIPALESLSLKNIEPISLMPLANAPALEEVIVSADFPQKFIDELKATRPELVIERQRSDD